MSVEDEMTHLYNRRGGTLAHQQILYLRRNKTPFLLFYADLDGLKTINDRYGHKDGDLAIVAVSEILCAALRESDIICRLGGYFSCSEDDTSLDKMLEAADNELYAEKQRKKRGRRIKLITWTLSLPK